MQLQKVTFEANRFCKPQVAGETLL